MICDEVKPNCIVKACCNETCWEAKNAMDSNLRMVKTAHAYAYGNMRKNEYCPVCHTHSFSYAITDRFENEVKPSKVNLCCMNCNVYIELIRTNDDWLIYDSCMSNHFTINPYNNIKLLKDIMLEAK